MDNAANRFHAYLLWSLHHQVLPQYYIPKQWYAVQTNMAVHSFSWNWLTSSRLSTGMGNGTIMEVITCGMATDNSLHYMVFFVSVLSYYGGGSNDPIQSISMWFLNDYSYLCNNRIRHASHWNSEPGRVFCFYGNIKIYCCPVNNYSPLYCFVVQCFIAIFTKGACLYTMRAESPIIT